MRRILAVLAVFLGLAAAIGGALAQTPFVAVTGGTVALSATGTTSRVAVSVDAYNPAVRIYNAGTVAVFIVCGDVTVVSTTALGIPIAPGTVEILGCNKGGYVAGITASGTATLYLTPGSGL